MLPPGAPSAAVNEENRSHADLLERRRKDNLATIKVLDEEHANNATRNITIG